MATLAHAPLLFCFLVSQKAQNRGSDWKRNETHLNQKQQWVELFNPARFPSASIKLQHDLYSQLSSAIASLGLVQPTSTYLSSPISLDCLDT